MTPSRNISRLIEIMAALRTPKTGCPWDLEQDFATIAPYTLEEAYEVADAIARNDLGDLEEELGDLLLQVVFHARMAEEQGAFDFGDVVEAITTKLIRRHPHVFGDLLLLGPRNSSSVGAVRQLGSQRRLDMLPPLVTPFNSASLHQSVAALARKEAQREPVIDAAEALKAGWLELWYQPKFNARTLQLCGAEALIRVRHPTWGLVPPAYFIPDRDDPCLSVLSNFVVNQAIEDWHYFTTQHHAVPIAVNLPFDFSRDPDSITNLCQRMPTHPAFDGLIVEINAADLIADLDLARAVARQVRFSNIAVSVDDLGSECLGACRAGRLPFCRGQGRPSVRCGLRR